MSNIVSALVDAIEESGLFEIALIYAFSKQLQVLNDKAQLKKIKHCHYVVNRNEIIFNIKQLKNNLKTKGLI